MNKTLKPLFACLFSGLICTGAAAAEPQVINIKTDGSSMVMSVPSDGEVLFHHFGGRIDDATPVTGIKSYRRTDHGTDNLARFVRGVIRHENERKRNILFRQPSHLRNGPI